MEPTFAPDPAQAAFVAATGQSQNPLKPIKGDSPGHAAFLNKLATSQQRIQVMPEMPVTVVNLNPYPLVVSHPLFHGLRIAARSSAEHFTAKAIREVRYEVDTGTDSNHTPVEFWPIQLGLEFVNQYAERGGVFMINGDLSRNPELEHTRDFKQKYEAADQQLVTYARKMKQLGDNEYNTPDHIGMKNIHSVHRQMATLLHERKLIAVLPKWMADDVIDPSNVPEDCPICRATPKKGALVCGGCSHILDPIGAYKAGAINELHVSLERLTREQVVALGCSAYVAETSDEKQKRTDAGRPKPKSRYELQQEIALENEMATRKAN